MGADAPASSLLCIEKGVITLSSHDSQYRWRYSCVTTPLCGNGIGFPHPMEHTGTLTPPIVLRTSVSHSAKGRHSVSKRRLYTLNSGNSWGLLRKRIGMGTPPPRAAPHSPSIIGIALYYQQAYPHPPFPDALMARHKAGKQGIRSGSVFPSLRSLGGAPDP